MESSQSSQAQREAFIWFTESQLRLVIRNGIVPEWFHGIISRKMAEELLMPKPPGYFLIRVSETRIGYTLSYRAGDRCRHFMINVLDDGHYIVVGENRRHRSLQDLVDFHRRTPIMPFSEVLTVACGQTSNDNTDYAELLFPNRHPNTNTRLQPNNCLHPSVSHPTSQQDVPPALPHRRNKPRSSPVLSPNRLYPALEEEFPTVVTPTPATRKRYAADSLPVPPPEVPARSSLPPLKQNQTCIRTASAPESPHTPTASEHQSVKNQEAKPSVVSNLINLKKKFVKKRSPSQEYMYAEINMEATESSGNAENEYQEIAAGPLSCTAPPLSYTCDVRLTDEELPHEYRPPPPFAPGY
ncbi:hematopoietic SH2 domain-containing protein homolog [Centropristis striata]|uniref:hematopoietic SH2 domain-containing protein homolog n=1 Tax=Centropristis striata TaxID=184440 RepID=UPI0027DF2ED7|nr:hematopoietic SH2 domain-containing protein homolog [Centropristis striata]